MSHTHRFRRSGFSLIELLVVMLIITILIGLTVVGSQYAIVKGGESKARIQLKALESGLERYNADKGDYPTSTGGSRDLYIALTGDTDTNQSLSDAEKANGLYLEELLHPGGKKGLIGWIDTSQGSLRIVDPFKEEWQYKRTGTPAQGDYSPAYDLYSYGTDATKNPTNSAKWIKNW